VQCPEVEGNEKLTGQLLEVEVASLQVRVVEVARQQRDGWQVGGGTQVMEGRSGGPWLVVDMAWELWLAAWDVRDVRGKGVVDISSAVAAQHLQSARGRVLGSTSLQDLPGAAVHTWLMPSSACKT
jgi:hypothetical protein